MMRSRVFVLFALALCLVACSCAHAHSDKSIKKIYTKEQRAAAAERALDNAMRSAERALNNIKENLQQANKILQRLEANKTHGEFAVTQAENKAKGNAEAEAVAKEAKSTMEEFNKLYPTVKSAAQAPVTNMIKLLQSAEALIKEGNVDMFSEADSSGNYRKIINKSSEFKTRAKEMEEKNTETAKSFAYPEQLVRNMSVFKLNAQAAVYKVIIIMYRTEIETALNNTDIYIRSAEKSRSEVNVTVNEIEKLCETAPQTLSVYCSAVINNEKGYLYTASRAVDEAKEVKNEILQLKQSTSAVLANIKKNTTDTENAFYESRMAKQYAEEVAKKFPLITRAAKSAEISAINANSTKKAFKRTLSKSKGEAFIENNKETEKQEQHLSNATGSSQNGSRVKPRLLNSKETVIEHSEDSMQQASDEPTTEEEEEEQPKDKSSAIKKDQLRKRYKNLTKDQLADSNFAAWSEWSDSAMTLSVPLLAALIASAVLQ